MVPLVAVGPRSDIGSVAPLGKTKVISLESEHETVSPESCVRGFDGRRSEPVLSACAAPKINTRSQTDPGVNLASYHTYDFVAEPGTNRGGYSTPITGYFKTAVTREMNARGYT